MRYVLHTTVTFVFFRLLLGSLSMHGQSEIQYHINESAFEYWIKIENVTDADDAKLPTTLFQKLFLVFPDFNSQTGTFHFISRKNKAQSEIQILLSEYDYVISDCLKKTIQKTLEEEKE